MSLHSLCWTSGWLPFTRVPFTGPHGEVFYGGSLLHGLQTVGAVCQDLAVAVTITAYRTTALRYADSTGGEESEATAISLCGARQQGDYQKLKALPWHLSFRQICHTSVVLCTAPLWENIPI